MDAQSPALLSTLWALVTLYQVHRESDLRASSATPSVPETPLSPPATVTPTLTPTRSSLLKTSGRSCCYEKGRAVLAQIQAIYSGMLSSSSSTSSSSQVLARSRVPNPMGQIRLFPSIRTPAEGRESISLGSIR